VTLEDTLSPYPLRALSFVPLEGRCCDPQRDPDRIVAHPETLSVSSALNVTNLHGEVPFSLVLLPSRQGAQAENQMPDP